MIGLQRLFDVVPDAPFKAVISSPIVLECLSSPEISFVLVDCIYTKLLADPSNILGGNWELLVFRILNITFEMHPELCTAAFILLGVKLLSSPELIASDKVISVLMNSKFLELIPGEIKSIVLKCEKLKALKIRFLEPNLYQNQALADFPTDFTQRVCKIRYELSQLLKELNSVSQNSESYPSIMFKISKVDGILEEISQQIVNTNKE